MNTRITGADLEQWSGRRSTQGELPALVRQLIMATVEPTRIQFPADEAIARRGLDGVLTVSGESGPYIPSGDSAWEASTNSDPKTKATSDYRKRVEGTTAQERAALTFVFVTSRSWAGANQWALDTKQLGDGWKNVQVIEAEDLATWLNVCPGVEAWLAENLNRPYGIVTLQRWFVRWSDYTDPSTPPDVPSAGRREDAIRLLNALDGSPTVVELCAGSTEEVVAFVAAALLLGVDFDLREQNAGAVVMSNDDDVASAELYEEKILFRAREPAELEALLARAVVLKTPDAWDRWSQHQSAQILIPLFYPDSVAEAVAVGHHVLLPRAARDANDTGRLTPISVESARDAWSAVGIDFRYADDYARSSRRNLKSLRRRIARHRRHRTPEWASGISAPLLATALLAGSWHTEAEGDVEVILKLTDRTRLRSLNRDLAPLTLGDDPVLFELGNYWKFVDLVDAWDELAGHLSSEDLSLFIQQVIPVLTETDPAQHLIGSDRLAYSLDPGRARRRFSRALRDGMATTLAILGSTVGNNRIAGNLTGADVANLVVRNLLDGADEERWIAVSDHLQSVAEAAPEQFLDAAESSLRDEKPAIMTLFTESDDGYGGRTTHHSQLLWALETLSFSRPLVARVATVMAELARRDPGGRLANRPAESLVSMLHLRTPQGAIDATNRLTIIDTIRRTSPNVAPKMMAELVRNSAHGLLIRRGPRYRNWTTARTEAKYDEVVASIDGIADRLVEDTAAGMNIDGWPLVAQIVRYLTVQSRTTVMESITHNWDTIALEAQTQISRTIADVADLHRRHPDSEWAMSDQSLAELDAFLVVHDQATDPTIDLFRWSPSDSDIRTESGRAILERRRVEAVREFLPDNMPGLVTLAHDIELPARLGYSLAEATSDLDDAVLDLLGRDDPVDQQFVSGFVNARSQTEDWLINQITARPALAAELMLLVEATHNRLDCVERFPSDQQDRYWKRADPSRVVDEAIGRYVEGFIVAGRLFAAISVVALRPDCSDLGLIQKVLKAPTERESIDTIKALHSAQYEIGRLLDILEEGSSSKRDLADLEWFYLPLLTQERLPRALHQRLASEPEFFAEVVSHIYMPDPPPEGTGGESEETDDRYSFSDACWRLVHSWRDPLPGAARGNMPDPEALQGWVGMVRDELGKRNRRTIASSIIGQALAARTTDEDGTWPCYAVRVVLEREQDDDLETNLAIARMNQRGATFRGAYDGGKQERLLAEKYRKYADDNRDEWPRTGKVLDQIVQSYEADARREDANVERRVIR